MSEDLRTETSVTIEVPIEKVWEALTTAELRKQWFFGVDTETDWKAGSPIVHRGEYQGKTYEDRGIILEIEPPRLLVHSHWSPVSGPPDTLENHERVSWGSPSVTAAQSSPSVNRIFPPRKPEVPPRRTGGWCWGT